LGQRMCFEPQRAHNHSCIDLMPFPPGRFITAAVDFPMVPATHWYRELIAHFACHGAALCVAKVVRIGRPAPANKAGLLGNEFDVIAIANPARLRQGERAFVYRRLGAPPPVRFL
jgi:hypothetical protein